MRPAVASYAIRTKTLEKYKFSNIFVVVHYGKKEKKKKLNRISVT
jgi:hypothetical protein